MERKELDRIISELYKSLDGNSVECVLPDGTKEELLLWDEPIYGVASAGDPIFESFRSKDIIGEWYMTPDKWIDGAKSVISVFFPASEKVRVTNRKQTDYSSVEWSYARVEGQAYIGQFMKALSERLSGEGINTVIPSMDERFFSIQAGKRSGSLPVGGSDIYPGADPDTFGSCWSERHAGFAAGLGTFGMSRGLITKKGMAGRMGSLITDELVPADERPYTDPYEYCIRCGACAKRCPAGAIPENGLKDHLKCAPWVGSSKKLLSPRYGCGLCQTAVPCEHGIPKKEK